MQIGGLEEEEEEEETLFAPNQARCYVHHLLVLCSRDSIGRTLNRPSIPYFDASLSVEINFGQKPMVCCNSGRKSCLSGSQRGTLKGSRKEDWQVH